MQKKAAEKGLSGAQYSLGLCFEKGHGVVQDSVKAVKWLKLAASKGEPVGHWKNIKLIFLFFLF